MSGPISREVRQFTAQIPSGAGTSNPFSLGGMALGGLVVPVIASGYLSFLVAASGSPSAGNNPGSDGPYSPLVDKAGGVISAVTPGNTGGVALDSTFLNSLMGYNGPVKISAATAQTAQATFWVHLKG